MKERGKTRAVWLAAAGGVLVMVMSIHPAGVVVGMIDGVLIVLALSVFWVPVLLAIVYYDLHAGLFRDDAGAVDEGFGPARLRIWSRWLPRGILVASIALTAAGWPRAAAFRVSRPAFERFAARIRSHELDGRTQPLGRWLGVYCVDEYGVDRRGGVYLRTYAGADGIGPDTMSYGVALRPDEEGTPFGKARYELTPIGGDWYEFAASNDY